MNFDAARRLVVLSSSWVHARPPLSGPISTRIENRYGSYCSSCPMQIPTVSDFAIPPALGLSSLLFATPPSRIPIAFFRNHCFRILGLLSLGALGLAADLGSVARGLGLPWLAVPPLPAIVILGFAPSTVFRDHESPLPILAVSLTSARLDLLLDPEVSDVTIGYRRLSQIRGAGSNPEGNIHPFDLATGERYRQERLRIPRRPETRYASPAPGSRID